MNQTSLMTVYTYLHFSPTSLDSSVIVGGKSAHSRFGFLLSRVDSRCSALVAGDSFL